MADRTPSPFIAIVGAGELGGATAQRLAELECVGEIRLIDPSEAVASGKALDILQAAPVERYATRLRGLADTRAVAGAAAVVIADRWGQPSTEWQGEDGLALLRGIWTLVSSDRTPIVCAGASHRTLVWAGVRELKIDRTRLVGSAPTAFEAAARSLVALAVDGAGRDIGLRVVGMVPESAVPCWSQATAGGALLTTLVTAATLAGLDARLPRLWPPAPYALGSAAAAVTSAIVSGSRRELTCFVALDGEVGVRRVVSALPVRLGPAGVLRIVEPALSPQERVRFDNGSVPVE
jgi:malate dehydrogenase